MAILREVELKKNPTKNELATLLVNENSTVFEIIKRLIRNGLLREEKDLEDRRKRRVLMTPEGREELKKAEIQTRKIAELLTGDLTLEALQFITLKFKELNDFHNTIYKNKKFTSIEDLL